MEARAVCSQLRATAPLGVLLRGRGFLKVNVAKFILALFGNKNNPRYIYLHGPGGIGKTHFVTKMSKWIDKLIPGGIRFEDLIISSADELEGSQERPGAILRVLRNQLIANRQGSIVFMDEATWLNREDMISSAKRVFNGDQSKVSTTYFGSGIEGTGIKLEIPPMLIFVASNDEIKDPALKSRFDTIKYPMPNKKALVAHALKLARNSKILGNREQPNQSDIKRWIETESINNFRQVEANIEQYLLHNDAREHEQPE